MLRGKSWGLRKKLEFGSSRPFSVLLQKLRTNSCPQLCFCFFVCFFCATVTDQNGPLWWWHISFFLPGLDEVGGAADHSGPKRLRSVTAPALTLPGCVWCSGREDSFRLYRLHRVAAQISKKCVCFFFIQATTHTHSREGERETMTYPKPRPARILFESQVWRVQLRCTNAA